MSSKVKWCMFTVQGYKSVKAKLGMKQVRPWKWMPFTNPARNDGAVLHHWRRTSDQGKEYPFAMFNKVGPVYPVLCECAEYLTILHSALLIIFPKKYLSFMLKQLEKWIRITIFTSFFVVSLSALLYDCLLLVVSES